MAAPWATRDVLRLIEYLGGEVRQAGEVVAVIPGRPAIPIPRNRTTVKKGTFGSICRLAGITVAQANEIRRAKFKR